MKIALIFAFSVALSKDIAEFIKEVEEYESNNVEDFIKEVENLTGVNLTEAFYGEWQDWSACSKTCGNGTRTRTRMCFREQELVLDVTKCEKDDDPTQQGFTESEVCNEQDCVVPTTQSEIFETISNLDQALGIDEGEDLLKDYENEDSIENSTFTAAPKNETTPMLVTIKIDGEEEISGTGGVIEIKGTTEVGNITEAGVTSNLQPDGIECDLRIEGLQGKDRWLWKSYPDLYYVLKVDETELSSSKNEVKQNRLDAEWSFTLPNHFEGGEKIKVEFYDKDVWNKDDLIGSAEFESAKLNEEICDEEDDGDDDDYYYAENIPCDKLVKLDAGTSPYRKDDTKYLMACEEKWINV